MRQNRQLSWIPAITLAFASMLLEACNGDLIDTGPKAQQAIQIVKASTSEGGLYSVSSNIEKMAADSGRAGDKWELDPWEAGMPSQKDALMNRLSEYFTFVRPTGDYWVRFTYKNKAGTHVALWNINVYTRKVEAQNEEAKNFTLPQAQS